MIDFISAKDGGIELFSGVASAVYASSTMDFADEEGFAHYDDANKMWNAAVDIYNWNVNKVA